MSLFQKGELLPIPSLDYSNEEELTDDTKLLYEKFDKKMDQCEYLAWICNNMVHVVAQRFIIHYKCKGFVVLLARHLQRSDPYTCTCKLYEY